MKTTVKLGSISSLIVEPIGKIPGVNFTAKIGAQTLDFCLHPDQAGALIFGIEQALEAAQIRRAAGFDAAASMAVQGA